MTNSENRRRLPATARLLARVISDPDKPEVEEQELKLASNNVHAVYSRSMRNGKVLLLSEEETEALGTEDADNAFKDVDTMLQLSPANKVEEPVVTQANVKQFAEDAAAARRTIQAAGSGFAFQFVEGLLTKALRTGQWILLDEINRWKKTRKEKAFSPQRAKN